MRRTRTAKSLRGCQFGIWSVLVLTTGVAIILGIGSMVSEHASEAWRCHQGYYGFRAIVSALIDYDQVHGHLPPSCFRDPQGCAMSSWRFQILPYIESGPGGYKLDAAWDGAANRSLAAEPCPPFCFASMEAGPEKQCRTNVLAVTGPRTAFDRQNRRGVSDLDPDTILVVQTDTSATHWMEPGDYDTNSMPNDIEQCDDAGISGNCRGGFFVGFADRQVWLLSNRTPFAILRQFFAVHRDKPGTREELLGPYRLSPE